MFDALCFPLHISLFLAFVDLALEARSVFDDFDRDKSGHIDAAELGNSLRVFGLNPTMKEIHDMINEVDKNGVLN